MTKIQLLKISLILVAISLLIYRFYKKRNQASETSNTEIKAPINFYSINDGNQNEIIYAPPYNKEWFAELDKKYSWENFDEYDNRFWEYMYNLFDTLPSIAGKTGNDQEFFNNLNRPQKVFYSLLVFNGDTDNGGVAQFFFNRPEFAFAILESFEELKMTKLKNDYEKCLNEFIGSSNSYVKRREIFDDKNLQWENRWKAFTDGYADIKSAEKVEDYYYSKEFKKELYRAFVDYADRNINLFVKK